MLFRSWLSIPAGGAGFLNVAANDLALKLELMILRPGHGQLDELVGSRRDDENVSPIIAWRQHAESAGVIGGIDPQLFPGE